MKTNKQQWGYGLPDQAYAPQAPAAVPTADNWRHRFKHLRGDLLDQEARSATIEADDDLVCYVLDHAAFEVLGGEHPQAAIRVLANLGRELGARLRRANRTIQELAS